MSCEFFYSFTASVQGGKVKASKCWWEKTGRFCITNTQLAEPAQPVVFPLWPDWSFGESGVKKSCL